MCTQAQCCCPSGFFLVSRLSSDSHVFVLTSMVSPSALLAVADVPKEDRSDSDEVVSRMPLEIGANASGSPWEVLASEAPECPGDVWPESRQSAMQKIHLRLLM